MREDEWRKRREELDRLHAKTTKLAEDAQALQRIAESKPGISDELVQWLAEKRARERQEGH
jgi:hypothetical protein